MVSVKKTTIEINGKQYGSVEEVPDNLKYLVEDMDNLKKLEKQRPKQKQKHYFLNSRKEVLEEVQL